MNRRAWIVTSWVLQNCAQPTLKRVLAEYTVAAFTRLYPRKDPAYKRRHPNPLPYDEWIRQAWENIHRHVGPARATRQDFRVLELVLRRGRATALKMRPKEFEAVEQAWLTTVRLFREVLAREVPVPVTESHPDYDRLWGFHPEKWMQDEVAG